MISLLLDILIRGLGYNGCYSQAIDYSSRLHFSICESETSGRYPASLVATKPGFISQTFKKKKHSQVFFGGGGVFASNLLDKKQHFHKTHWTVATQRNVKFPHICGLQKCSLPTFVLVTALPWHILWTKSQGMSVRHIRFLDDKDLTLVHPIQPSNEDFGFLKGQK